MYVVCVVVDSNEWWRLFLSYVVGGSRVENFPVRAFTRTFVLMAVGSG